LYFIVKKRLSTSIALWLFPIFWVTFEWAHNLGELSYPWLTLGNTQIYNSLWVQFVDITGVWGASLLLATMNVILTKLILNFSKFKHFSDFVKHPQNSILITSALLIIIIPLLYGVVRISQFKHEDLIKNKPTVSVGLIQPAINPWRKWEISVDEMIKLQMDIADSLINEGLKPDLIIWNETAIPSYVRINHKYDYWNLLDWCDKQKISLLSGFAELRYYNSENKTVTARIDSNQTDTYYESYNSCMLIQSGDTDLPQVYTKMRLTPMAERLPYSEFLMFMRSWFEWGVGISAWGIGTEQKNLNLYLNSDTAKIGPVICIESIYPEFVSIAALSGAEFLVIITNDAWYDYTPGPEQHYLIAAMRAIENRRYIARCANTGVTGVISPTGKTISRLKEYNKLGLYEIVPRITELTFYSKHGDWLALTTFFISLLSVIFSYLKKKI